MAKTATGVTPSGKRLYIDGPNPAKRVQSFSSDADIAEEKLLELNNTEVAEKTRDLSVRASVEFNCVGSVAPFMQALGQGLWQNEAAPTAVMTDAMFDDAAVDIITHQSNDNVAIDFAEWNGYCFLTSFSFNFPADGVATESYEFEGEHNRFFLNDWKNTLVYKADYSDANTLLISGTNLESTHQPVLLLENQDVVAELSDTNESITLTDSGADTEVTATDADGSRTFTDGKRYRVIVSGSGNSFSTFSSTPDGIGGLRRGHVLAYLYNPAGNMEQTLRIQSVAIDGDLSREEQVELGSKKPYYRKLTRPINVSLSVEVNETDLEEYAKIVGSETAYDAGTLREIDMDDMLRNSVFELVAYKSETAHTQANELMRIKMTSVSVAGSGGSVSAGDTVGTRTFSLTAENILVSGSGVSYLV